MSEKQGKMFAWLARKLGLWVLLFFSASAFIFLASLTIQEDAIALQMKNPDAATVAKLKKELGLDESYATQWFRYVGDFF